MSLQATTSQTVGPYFKIGMRWLADVNLAGADVPGERVEIRGRIVDGDGVPIPDAVLEIWQANASGKYAHPEDTQSKPVVPGLSGYGRVYVDANGSFCIRTIKPGAVPGPDGKEQAPHLLISIFMRGLLKRLVTRIYFPNEPRNGEDYVLNLVEPERRATLVAKPVAGQPGALAWNVFMQGPDETVFFDIGL